MATSSVGSAGRANARSGYVSLWGGRRLAQRLPNYTPPEKTLLSLSQSTQLWASTQLVLVCRVLGAGVVQGRFAPECQQYFCGCGTRVRPSWTCARVLDGGAEENPPFSSVVVE